MSSPLVAFDADTLGRERTGDESYAENLLRELGTFADDVRIAAVTRHPERVPPGIEAIELKVRSQVARMAVGLPRLLRRIRPALGHFLYVVPPLWRGPAVVTVHDLSFERQPELMTPRDRVLFRTFVPRSARRADRVFTPSELTKRDLIELYELPEEKVVVTPNGVDPAYGPNGSHEASGRPYILLVGAIQPRKDPLTALEALTRLDPELRLVFAGPEKQGGTEVREAIARLGLERRVELLGHVEKPTLAGLYRGAACVMLPSRYEGFGLPLVEAMASGTPVVATLAGSIPEVAADAAVLVEPGDPVALAEGVERALADRETLVAAGFERARAFSWPATARVTLDVYRELV
jgi:glycosyltransferase involved in cell wall biosynthesis